MAQDNRRIIRVVVPPGVTEAQALSRLREAGFLAADPPVAAPDTVYAVGVELTDGTCDSFADGPYPDVETLLAHDPKLAGYGPNNLSYAIFELNGGREPDRVLYRWEGQKWKPVKHRRQR